MRRVWSILSLLLWLSLWAGATHAAPNDTAPGRISFVKNGSLWLWEAGQEREIVRGTDVSTPGFSSDGRYIAFRQKGSLYVIRQDGTGPWKLPGDDYRWSPSGNLLALEAPSGVLIVPISEEGPGEPRLVAPNWHGAAWSPDGQRLAMVKLERGEQSMTGTSLIGVLVLADSQPRVIWQESFHADESKGAYGQAGGLRWSSDGRWLSFMRYGMTASSASDRNQLVVLPSIGGRPVMLGEMVYNSAFYNWSPSGAMMAFTDGTWRSVWENKQVRVAPMPPRSPFRSLTPEGYADREPAWHPSGQYLALSRSKAKEPRPSKLPAEEQAIWMLPVSTGQSWKVTGSDGGVAPIWGGDGSLLWVLPPGDQRPASLWWKPSGNNGHARELIRGLSIHFEFYGQWRWRDVYDWWRPQLLIEAREAHIMSRGQRI
jgi:dipeptidyl aminopeptidase/acylaminoacyl peptidase